MRLITVLVPKEHLDALDELVRNRKDSSRSELIRLGISLFLKEEKMTVKYILLRQALKDMQTMMEDPDLFL